MLLAGNGSVYTLDQITGDLASWQGLEWLKNNGRAR